MNLYEQNAKVREITTGREGIVTGDITDHNGGVILYAVTERKEGDYINWFQTYPHLLEVIG